MLMVVNLGKFTTEIKIGIRVYKPSNIPEPKSKF